ncbi:hypothetical protein ULMS_14400 [Patiriisocius marinistellae]|uniref:Heat-shock protein Hsp90 n=1 Tax=Patiriisocius marinistellae TaxID=2494560 RepID=A0A5J4FXM7_9FLAO|nr:DUF6503 family protein [Patiriisocius marinistellae]GEQ85932.1 hypothetical protein ULMS_14400 [Patiriisocius marinistellae]
MKKIVLVLSFGMLLFSCKNDKISEEKTIETLETNKEEMPKRQVDSLVGLIENTHNRDMFVSKEAVAFDIAIAFGGNEILNGKMVLLTNSGGGRIDLKDGNSIIANQNGVFASPGLAENERVRFNAYTWSYFFSLPYKLADEGTKWSSISQRNFNDTTYNTRSLTFADGTGDAPDDWYVVYTDTETNRLDAAAYIVTLGKTKAEAEADPHAISYENYELISGVPVAKDWKFWEWTLDNGFGKEIGNAKISNVEFVDVPENFFEPSKDFVNK